MHRVSFNFISLMTVSALVGAALFASTSHAETCPAPGDITFSPDTQYPSSGIYQTASGWSSGLVTNTGLPDQLIEAAIKVNPSDDSVACSYRNSENNFPFSMYPPTDDQATPDTTASDNLWVSGRVWSVCTDPTSGQVSPANCPFHYLLPPVENSSVNPFGKPVKPHN